MSHVYAINEIVGTSEVGIEHAIKTALATAAETVRNMDWFEVGEIRGHIENGKIAHYQVKIRWASATNAPARRRNQRTEDSEQRTE